MRKLTATLCLMIAVLIGNEVRGSDLNICIGSPLDVKGFFDYPDWDNCQGTIKFANGDQYVGEFSGGQWQGQGTFTYAGGSKYAGTFSDGKKHGQGTYTFASGNKYVGEFKEGEQHGQGTYTHADGTAEKGIWKDGEFQYAQKPSKTVKKSPPPSKTAAKKENERLRKEVARLKKQKQSRPKQVAKKPTPKKSKKVIAASSGSGFAISREGHVITNEHVIEGCQNVKIHHNGKSISATVLTFDLRNDIALLKGNFRPSAVFPLSNEKTKLMQDIYVAGYPFGRKVSTSVKVTRGIVSSLTGLGNNFSNIQIDAALQPGNSGGPILNDRGNVVGVAVSKLDFKQILKKYGTIPENTNFGVKTSVVKSITDSMDISLPSPNKSSISKSKLGKMISDGTYYLSCWMTMAQIKRMKSKKVIFQNLD